jgi:hypothetical protein
MVRSSTGVVFAALSLAACSALNPSDPDPTPLNPTAVLETRMVNEGVAGFPAFETTSRVYTRGKMQRSESTFRGGGPITRLLSATSNARIERLDKKLVWTLDEKNRQYTQCPLKGCPSTAGKQRPEKTAGRDLAEEAGCRLRPGNSAVAIEPTGQKRSINGFDTEQYQVTWTVTLRDNASHKSTSTLGIDLWMTPLTSGLKEALALEKAYARASEKRGGDPAETGGAAFPSEVARMLDDYLSPSVSPADREKFLAGAKKLGKVKGYPIATKVVWTFSGEACNMDETMKDMGDKPLLTFRSEVKAHKMEAMHDSVFSPPTDYKIRK